MSINIDVFAPIGLPIDIQEKIASMCNCDGNIRTCGRHIGHGKFIESMSIEAAQRYLIDLVQELDKGNDGVFNDAWCKETDRKWSELREYDQGTRGIVFPVASFKTADEFWGSTTRSRLRDDAVRYILYYRSGCKIQWDGQEQAHED